MINKALLRLSVSGGLFLLFVLAGCTSATVDETKTAVLPTPHEITQVEAETAVPTNTPLPTNPPKYPHLQNPQSPPTRLNQPLPLPQLSPSKMSNQF